MKIWLHFHIKMRFIATKIWLIEHRIITIFDWFSYRIERNFKQPSFAYQRPDKEEEEREERYLKSQISEIELKILHRILNISQHLNTEEHRYFLPIDVAQFQIQTIAIWHYLPNWIKRKEFNYKQSPILVIPYNTKVSTWGSIDHLYQSMFRNWFLFSIHKYWCKNDINWRNTSFNTGWNTRYIYKMSHGQINTTNVNEQQ